MTPLFEIAIARLDVSPKMLLEDSAILTTDERARAERCVFETGRRRFIAARAALRRHLAMRLNAHPQNVEFVYNDRGKPSLGGRFAKSKVFFNLSHSDDLAVYAFSTIGPIGVDVESVRWFADADKVAARVFSPAENDVYSKLEQSEKPIGFFNCWTRKEAFIKATGEGLSRSLHSFDVSLAPRDRARILRIGEHANKVCGWLMHSFAPLSGFVSAVVVHNS